MERAGTTNQQARGGAVQKPAVKSQLAEAHSCWCAHLGRLAAGSPAAAAVRMRVRFVGPVVHRLVRCAWLRLAGVGVKPHQAKGPPGGGVGQACLLQRLESLDCT